MRDRSPSDTLILLIKFKQMNLQEQINEDLRVAIATQNHPVRDLLRVVIAEFSHEKTKLLDDETVIKVLKTFSGHCIECNNFEEPKMLEHYLPEEMNEEQMKEIVKIVINFHKYTQKDMGKIMPACKTSLGKDFDGKRVSKILKEIFA